MGGQGGQQGGQHGMQNQQMMQGLAQLLQARQGQMQGGGSVPAGQNNPGSGLHRFADNSGLGVPSGVISQPRNYTPQHTSAYRPIMGTDSARSAMTALQGGAQGFGSNPSHGSTQGAPPGMVYQHRGYSGGSDTDSDYRLVPQDQAVPAAPVQGGKG